MEYCFGSMAAVEGFSKEKSSAVEDYMCFRWCPDRLDLPFTRLC